MKDFKRIAGDILCGVDYDIYKDDCNEMENELRDEIEARLVDEFGLYDEMHEMLNACSKILKQCDLHNTSREIDELLAKARGES